MGLFEVAKAIMPKALLPSSLLRVSTQRKTGNIIAGGPFAGMHFLDAPVWGAYTPKLLGTYELELRPFIERLVASEPRHLIDIGGAEGYYAVGMLMRVPELRVSVFERLEQGRQAIAQLARMNGVESRLSVLGSCDPAALSARLRETQASALISDVEGYEVELLDPALVPELANMTMLVEVHDSKMPNCTELVTQKFEATHRIEHVRQQKRVLRDYPYRDVASVLFPTLVERYGVNEFRNVGNAWVWLEPRSIARSSA
ncbi:MAG TPA: hypothetical protein VEQ59_08940 [Polyangiaceae bacterium]|nr:hypothetical protein [Polyangiaceae bacterium]